MLVGCGGGVGSGGTGMASGLTEGTVNGYGSVFVDGDRFDDSDVATYAETAPGVATQTSAPGRASRSNPTRARPAPARRGVGDRRGRGARADGFSVLGQAVRVNGNAALGPVTQFGGGYGGLAAVNAGDAGGGARLRAAHGDGLRAAGHARRATARRCPSFVGQRSVSGSGPSGFSSARCAC